MALASILSRIGSTTRRGRHSRQRRIRRLWRRRRSNYRSRPQWKRPTRRQQDNRTSPTINGQLATSNTSASGENRFCENASNCSPQVNNDRAEYVQPLDEATMRDTRATRDPSGTDDSTSASCGTSSFKPSTNPSEKYLLTSSGLTQDSGYTETSVDSITVPIQQPAGTTDNVEYGITTKKLENSLYHILKAVTAIQIEDNTDAHMENIDHAVADVVADAGINLPDFGDITCSNSVSKAEQDKCSNMEPKVYQRVRCGGISLERMSLSADGNAVVGTVLVLNDCYEKSVFVRHTSNAWDTFTDAPAEWVETVEDGAMDRFKFSVELPKESYSVEMAFSFNQQWDNNNTKNYNVSCTIF